MKKVIKKKMSIEDLALSMNKGFKRVEKNLENLIEKKIDGLAASTAKGFENTVTKDDIKNMATKTDIEGLKNQIQGVNNRIDDLAINRIKTEDHNKLKTRVVVLEEKVK